jgi:DNA-binding protein HU-beta
MAKKSTKGTMAKVGDAVKKATKTVAETTQEYVVKPVGKMLGGTGKKKTTKSATAKKKTGTKAAASSAAKKTTAKKTTAKKTTGKKTAAKKK